MTTGNALNGKPYAGNPHVRFDEGEVASAAMPRRGSLLYKNTMLKKTMPLVAATWTDAFRRVRNRIALVAAAICAAAAPLSSFAEAKSATLKATGYSGSTLTGFQMLVKLSASNDAYGFSYNEAGGASHNIWFTSVDGATVYPHEIDKWDTSGDSFVWVRLPELASGTTFKMHWSDSASDVQPASGNVWDGYVGVWHMNEDGTTAASDSTANGIGAAPVNNSGASTSIGTATGKVGAGRAVTQGTMLKVTGHASNGRISDAKVFTVGGWVNRTATGSYPRIFCGNVDSGRTQWELFATADNDISVRGGSKEFSGCAVNNGTSSGWHYLTVVYNGTTATLYDNGTSYVKSGTINNAAQGNFFTIGGWTGRNDRSFVGTFDEVRMYNGALSADRIAADYATMNDPTTFLTLYVPQNEPDAYLEYVESDGHQWIDLGVQPGPTTSVTPAITSMIVDADVDIIGGNSDCDLVGLSYNNFEPIKTYNGKYSAYVKNGGETTSGVAINSGRHRVITTAVQGQRLSISVDGNATTSGGNVVANGTGGNTLYLFARHGPDRYCSAKLYGLKIYINNELVRDFVPGMKGREVGLYDRLNDEWYTSESGTSLLRGPITSRNNASLSNAPDAYLESVESDGRQWVDSGVIPGPTANVTPAITSMIVDADVDIIGGNSDCDLVGIGYNNFEPIRTFNGKYSAYVKNAYETTSGVAINSGRHRVITTAVQGQRLSISVDGDTTTSGGNVVANNPGGNSLYLFARHGPDRYCSAKLYGLKIYINNELVRDYVPGIKNGVAGLYDMLNDVWYVSQSNAELIPGPVKERHNEPQVYIDYVKSTGSQWVDSGVLPGPAANVSPAITSMVIDADVDITGGTGEYDLVGLSYNNFEPIKTLNGKYSAYVKNSGNTTSGVAINTGRHRVITTAVNGQKLAISVDGVTTTAGSNVATFSNGGNTLYIFARKATDRYCSAKLWGMKIYINNILKRDFVPGIKDDVVGLYDRVSDMFLSSGSGTPLVAGPVVDRSKPDAFVEYVESNGSQWVDTGVDGRAGVKAEADIEWINGNAPLGVIGNTHCLLLQALGTIGGQALGSGEIKTGIALDSGRHLIVSEAPAGSKMTITVDGTTTAQSPNNVSASGDTGMTIWMFAAHGSGGKWGEGSSKFYELKLWRTGSDGVRRIQRHFIPCVKGGRAGLYDAVSGVIFYSHSGTDLVASSTTRTLSVWRNEADDASLDNAANWCGGLPNGTDAVVCAPWLQTVSTANDLVCANLTVHNGAAIDLSGHTLTLTGLTGANSGSFVSGAAVTLDLSGRTDLRTIAKSANPYVVTWESQPSATFTLDSESSRRFKIEPDATGVKIIYIAGGAMLIVY